MTNVPESAAGAEPSIPDITWIDPTDWVAIIEQSSLRREMYDLHVDGLAADVVFGIDFGKEPKIQAEMREAPQLVQRQRFHVDKVKPTSKRLSPKRKISKLR